MPIKANIINGHGEAHPAKVSKRGEVAVSPVEYSEAYNAEASVANTAANFISPIHGKIFIITGISLRANQNVSNTVDASVVIYESESPTSIVSTSDKYNTNMIRRDFLNLSGLFLRTNPGKWINLKTTDASIFGTIFGYYTSE